MNKIFLYLLLIAIGFPVGAQTTYPENGVEDERDIFHAFTNAQIHVSPSNKLDSGILIIRNDRVVAVGKNISIPNGAVIHNCSGLVIYPSFIDAYAGFNYTKPNKKSKVNTPTKAGNWNPAIKPEREFHPSFPIEDKVKKDWLSCGIGIANLHERDGIMRGQSSIVLIGIDEANNSVIADQAIQHLSFSKGTSKDDYPSSHIGAIALLRQTYYDAQWYATQKGTKEELNPSLHAINYTKNAPLFFELNHPHSWRNVNDIADEFGLQFTVKGTGREYLLRSEVVSGSRVIAPVYLPDPYDVQDPFEARMVSLGELKHWEAAPFNPYFLLKSGAEVALSRDTISSAKSFLKNLHRISKAGLSHDQLLAMLTTTPARFLRIDQFYGTLENGMIANFFIAPNRVTEEGFEVYEHWNRGERVYQTVIPNQSLVGQYNLVIEKVNYTLRIEEVTKEKIKATAVRTSDGLAINATVENEGSLLTIVMHSTSKKDPFQFRLSGKISLKGSVWDGYGQDTQGRWITWAAIKDRKTPSHSNKQAQNDSDSLVIPSLSYPNMAFGLDSIEASNTFVITNAIVWTCADTGTLELADIWVENGKIKKVGIGTMFPSDLKRIDARGKHVTPGIVDEHSHIAIRGGVNEWAQASSAEVRIADAIDPWNIHIYRQLGGGVTSAQLLHGSANPIGGQSALIKLKWGQPAENMLIKDADGFIKFALGENVKRSNRKDDGGRFPLTRMGVEQSFVDAFTRAKAYDSLKPNPNPTSKPLLKLKTNTPIPSNYRTDLELEAISEILNRERFITCHSYVESEILMLMDVAEQFDIKVNTFTHILEGYKVAPELAEHGVSGSTFSDWWAYKFEVNDAIPYNAAIMHKAGVNTAINSDDAEMGRRLNQEAAKTMKYGGVSPEDALKMITINPAKALHLDQRIGTIEVGKDADLVIWSGHPLSVYTKPEKTFIEGVKYFDLQQHNALQKRDATERARLLQKMIEAEASKKKKPTPENKMEFHCDTELQEYSNP